MYLVLNLPLDEIVIHYFSSVLAGLVLCIFEVLGRVNISGHWRPWCMIKDDNDGQMIFGELGGLKLPDIWLTGEEKPRKNLTQETCPDRGSNPGLLCDKRACCHLLHSGGLFFFKWLLLYAHQALKIPGCEFSWTARNAFDKQVSSSVQ